MAEIRDTFVLDTSPAERAIDELERALNRALGQVKVDIDTESFRAVDRSLDEIEASVKSVSLETAAIAVGADKAEVDFRQLASALDLSEDEARRLTAELLESQVASAK